MSVDEYWMLACFFFGMLIGRLTGSQRANDDD